MASFGGGGSSGGVSGDGCPPVAPCGNGVVDVSGGEDCDPGNPKSGAPMDLGISTCSTLGLSGNDLSCNCRCEFDLSRCTP